jgi:C-terminal processing protease CtpA/Prc
MLNNETYIFQIISLPYIMLKPLLITAFLIALLTAGTQAQTLSRDSIINIAKADAKNFRLNDADLKKFKKKWKKTSDYFKPTKTNVSDTTLLRDSVYVQTYRYVAYVKTRSRHSTGYYVIFGAGTATWVAVLIAIFFHLAKG